MTRKIFLANVFPNKKKTLLNKTFNNTALLQRMFINIYFLFNKHDDIY